MLIKALCDYYDILSEAGKVLPDGYSSVKISYKISITEDGQLDGIIPCKKTELVPAGKDKMKEKQIPIDVVMPKRTEKTGIDANISDHRPVYIFGLNMDNDKLTAEDRTDKAKKSHEAFVNKNLEFIKGIDSPVVNAFRNFFVNWKPDTETENDNLLALGKEYGKSGFVFCLSKNPDILLHEDSTFKKKWGEVYEESLEDDGMYLAQCAVSGDKNVPIARIHNKIKGVYGGLATGSVLIGFNNASENSYGHEKSYNSGISEKMMKKYTEALNYLLSSTRHKMMMDDVTIVFWAMDSREKDEDLFSSIFANRDDRMNAEKTERMLREMLSDGSQGKVTLAKLEAEGVVVPEVDFYMLGLKPNSSRLSIKFFIRKKYAEVLWNIARFQQDIQITKEFKTICLSWIKKEMISPKSTNDKINPALFSKFFEAIIYGRPYPEFLLETMVRRVKTDSEKVNSIRAGVIKAYINRKYPKEELKVKLDKENVDQAYVCGRLFAVLEKLQQEASGNTLNRTIKDAYFPSAAATPTLVFPKLVILAQNHMNKVKYPIRYKKLIGEIIDKLDGSFPETFSLKEQGEFIVGYYHQYQSFFEKAEKETEEN